MVIKDGFKENRIIEEKMFEMLNDICLNEDESQDIDVTDEEMKIIKAKVYKNIGIKPKKKIMRRLAMAASIVIVLCVPFSNATVWANIKSVLEFIPGIGVVENTGAGGTHFMLIKSITKSYSNGKIIIRGFDIDNQNATLSIGGDKIHSFNSVEIEDNDSNIYKMNEYASEDYTGDTKWNKVYKYSGHIKAGKDYTIIFNNEIKIPMSLVAANGVKELNKLGTTVAIDGINLTAVAVMEGDKLRVDLLAPQNSIAKSLQYPDSYLALNDENAIPQNTEKNMINSSPIYLTNNTSVKYTAYMSPNMALGGHEYYFKTGNVTNKQYTLTISEILMNYNSTNIPFSLDLPKNGETSPKQIVNIAGYPVGVSIKKVSATKVRVNVDINYNKALKNNLVSFSLHGPSIKNDSVSEQDLMQTDLDSLPAYFEFNIDKNIKHLNLEFDRPEIEEKGPWNFDIKLK